MGAAKKILIIDDDPDICTYVSEVLQDNGFETITACDGADAMSKTIEAPPDLIVVDLMMPKKSGVKFLHELKRDATLKKIPIIVLSGATGVTGVDMMRYLQEQPFMERKEKVMGAASSITPNAYLEKPVDPATLADTVKRLLDR